jgi:tetratricopeptide (TPR) repeat protein
MNAPSLTLDAEALRLMRAGRLGEALQVAQRAVATQELCAPAHGVLAAILLKLGRPAEADAVVERAARYAAGTAEAYDSLALASVALGRHDRANALYRRAVECSPNVSRHWYNLASSERGFGRFAEAEAACDRAIALDAREYRGYLLRSELRVQTPTANHVAQLRREVSRSDLDDNARILLGYALGKELDDLEQYDDAFESFALGASARRRQLAYDVRIDEHKLRRIIEAFPPAPDRTASGRIDSSRFVFIFGLPRSGTTLLERILTGLPAVRSNGETDHFARTLLTAPPGPPTDAVRGGRDVFARAAAADWDTVAAGYARLAGAGGKPEAVIEKQPMNYLYLGAIRRALPQARLVLVSRSPLDICFAMYRTLFGEAYQFSYDFSDLARYYAAYARLVDHWRDAFGASLHEVRYDDLVSDPIRVGAAAAAACGLEWRDAAVEVERNAAVCLTQSAAQVRRPIYGSSSGRWRHYRAHLEPLIQTLRDQGVGLAELDRPVSC